MRLGKLDPLHDERTLMLTDFIRPEMRAPRNYDFDKHKTPLLAQTWGNEDWADCVLAGQANHLLRLERVEQRRTLPLSGQTVIDRYRAMSGAINPGDGKDVGLHVLDGLKSWRNKGWLVNGRKYTIAAYGELDVFDQDRLRQICFALHGIHLGLQLPIAVQGAEDVWDYQGEVSHEWGIGSWGGHCVYSKAFDRDSFEILSWGRKIRITNAFLTAYVDEAWGVVDDLNAWRVRNTVNVPALIERLKQTTDTVFSD